MKKIRNILALALSLCLICTLAPLSALAEPAIVAEGYFPNSSVFWRVTDDNVLTIGGTGAMPDIYVSSIGQSSPYYSYRNSITALKIEEGITAICPYAFIQFRNISGSLVIPDSVETIAYSSFHGCSGFNGTLKLGSENSHLKTIGDNAFNGCSGFTGNLTIPAGVTSIGKSAFWGCSGFTGNLTIPQGMTVIEERSFYGCSGFDGTLDLGGAGGALQSIGTAAFENCSNFTGSLVIPDSVTTIGREAFSFDKGFSGTLTLGGETSRLQTIPGYAFNGCTGFTGPLVIPDNVTSIGECAFLSCSGFESLAFGRGHTQLQTISNQAFWGCKGFSGNLKIPDTVTGIGASAFSGCTGFNGTLTLGSTNSLLQTIGGYAFWGCSSFTGTLTIPDSVNIIGGYAFQLCQKFTALILGGEDSQLQTIGEYAFSCCYKLTGNLLIPDRVTQIKGNAFERCGSINGTLTIGNAVQSIGESAFYNCSKLTGKLRIPESVTSIGSCAFHGCAKDSDILTFFADHPEFIEVIQTAYTAPTITSDGSVTYQVNCTDPSHTTDAQKFITNVTKEIPYIYIDTITADPAEVTLAIGKTAQIGTTVTPLDAMDPTVAFSSDNTDVVTVDNTGMLTAVAPGTATITIVPADGSDHTTATVTVTVYDLTVPEKVVVAVDGTASAAATVNPDTAVTPARTYTSSDESIFTVDADGNITPVAAGTATVTVTDGEITKTIPVTVVNATVSVDKDTLAKDETADISVTALPDGTAAVQSVSYVSSDETILTVSDAGVVTALKTGDATVTVTASILAAGETVTVTKTLAFSAYTPVTSITATAEKTLLDMEDAPYTQITVTVLPEDADNKNVIYTSSDPTVLDVEADGLVIALHKGTATVTITAADGYGAETTIDFTVTHDLYALRVGPTVEEEETGEATVETNTVRRFTVRYTSSDPEILEVDPDTGAFTAKKKGTVTVTAELDFEDGGHKTLSQDVLVRDPHEGEFRCSRCDWYDEVKDTPGIRGVIYWMIHTITHFVELINSMT